MDHLLDRLYAETRSEVYGEIAAVARALESRDAYTEHHSEGVSDVAYDLAILMGLGLWEAERVRAAARLHDLGKLLTPDAVLLKPGKLEPDERAIMELHPGDLRGVLGNPKFLAEELLWAEAHHENGMEQGIRKGSRERKYL